LESALLNYTWVDSVVPVETNIVVIVLKDAEKRDAIIQQLKDHGVLTVAFGLGMIRMVTHLDVDDAGIDHVCETLKKVSA